MANREEQVAKAVAIGHVLSKDQARAPRKKIDMFTIFPLLTLSLIVYILFTLIGGGSGWVDADIVSITMLSNDVWLVKGGDLFLAFSLLMLFFEILRSTKTGTESILNHAFSALVFVACLICFMIAPGFSTSAFFLLMLMTCMDFMAGFIVTTLAARRDFGVSNGLGAG